MNLAGAVAECYVLNCVPPPHSCVETLIPDVSVFGDRAQLSDKHLTQTEIKFK